MKMGQKLKEQICSQVIFLGANVLATVNFEPCKDECGAFFCKYPAPYSNSMSKNCVSFGWFLFSVDENDLFLGYAMGRSAFWVQF